MRDPSRGHKFPFFLRVDLYDFVVAHLETKDWEPQKSHKENTKQPSKPFSNINPNFDTSLSNNKL